MLVFSPHLIGGSPCGDTPVARGIVFLVLSALAGPGFAPVSTGSASQPPGASVQPGAQVQVASLQGKGNLASKMMQDVDTANRMISYGRQGKNAEFLLLVAQ